MGNRRPQLSDLRDSGEIEQDADIVIALHGELDADADGNRAVEIGLLKHRGGRVGWLDHQQFQFRGRTQQMVEIDNGSGFVQRYGSGGGKAEAVSGKDRAAGIEA